MNRQGTTGFAGQEEKQRKRKGLIFCSEDKADFQELLPGVSRATVWGDPDKGPYGAFTRFEPGFDAGMHRHTHDVWMIVLRGAYLYKGDTGEKRIGPGDFLRIPGGTKHWSGGDPKEGALFYDESFESFDFVPAD